MTDMPAWLRQHLDDLGVTNSDGIGRTVRHRHCPTCHANVLTGLDADRCALPVTADPTPLDAVGELLAVTTGRATLDLTLSPLRLDHRDRWRIRSRRPAVVLAEHRCGQPLPAASTPPPQLRRRAAAWPTHVDF